MKWGSRSWARVGAAAFAAALLYPLSAFFVRIGQWQWGKEVRGPALASIRVSLALTTLAMIVVVALGTPIAVYVARCRTRERLIWQALLLVSILLPPLALGILLALAFRPDGWVGGWLQYFGVRTSNSATAFVATQVYVSIGYYILGAVAALESVPAMLLKQAALLGAAPWKVFVRITFPLARLGLAAALSMAWVRALGEFGAVVVTAYYPSGMPVQLWNSLESFGLPAVMPLLMVFLGTALPLPWLVHVLAQRRSHA